MAVSVLLLRGLVEAVEHAGVSRDRFLALARFDPRRLDDVEGRLELDEYEALQELALDVTGDAALGLHMGRAASAATYNLAAHLVVHATSLRTGIEGLVRFHRLLVDRPVWHVEEDHRTVTLAYDVRATSARCRRLRAEIMMTGFYRMMRYFARGSMPDCVAFDYAAPTYRDEYARTFDGTERFEQSFTGIVIDRALMDAGQPNHDAEFHAALEVQASKRVARLARTSTYAERVREHVLGLRTPERRDMRAAARALGVSVRTLRRRLNEEGASYQVVVDEALALLAKQLLADERRSIQETADAVGFSDPGAFSRAFKRWTGSTPKRFQREQTQSRSPS